MANTKANIQNIPLTGTLNFNTLKTDVKPFNGYNEKNSTVFGGTLGPFYDKKTELYDSATSYSIFDSNNNAFTMELAGDNYFRIKDENGTILETSDNNLCITKKLVNLPSDTFWAAQFTRKGPNSDYKGVCQFAITNTGRFYHRSLLSNGTNHPLEDIDNVAWSSPVNYSTTIRNIAAATAFYNTLTDSVIIGVCGFYNSTGNNEIFTTLSIWGSYSGNTFTINNTQYMNATKVRWGSEFPCISIYKDMTNDTYKVRFISNSGKLKTDDISNLVVVEHTNNSTSTIDNKVWTIASDDFNSLDSIYGISYNLLDPRSSEVGMATAEVYQFLVRKTYCSNDSDLFTSPIYYDTLGWTGHDGNGFIPTPKTRSGFVTYLGGALLSVSSIGKWAIPITYPSNFADNLISYNAYSSVSNTYAQNINYKASGNTFYCFICNSNKCYNSNVPISQRLKDMTIDDRYIILGNKGIYDIETKSIIKGSQYLGYIETGVPVSASLSSTDTSLYTSMYSGGYNAGYQINNNRFIGYLYDAVPIKNCPPNCKFINNTITGSPDLYDIQRYFTESTVVGSPLYVGSNPLYSGTYMPALTSVMLPFSLDARLTNGYGNNNFIKVDNTSFFLATFNNNTNLYAAFWETRTENVTGVFSIQSQRYVTDENNVYLANYAYGSAANTFTVGAYKKNLRYIGSLPTMAIFWSDFSKSFFSFTGDSILRKYFEASDINEIYYVGQNPSSQSIWVCTDKGIFILSDSDQYKLNLISKQVDFKKDLAIIVSEENNKWVEHRISLYKVEEDAEEVPIKLKTCFYGLGSNMKANFDCWYIRVFDPKREGNYLKLKVNTITDVSRQTEEKIFKFSPSDYDENNIAYVKYQPKYQDAVAMQLELESDIQIYQIDLGVNANTATAQLSHNNF